MAHNLKDVRDFLYKIQKKRDKSNSEIIDTLGDRKNILNLKILVAIDVSGSISQSQYKQFMHQIDLIKGLSVIKIMETDTKVVALYDYTKTSKNRIARLTGGGGTCFVEAFDWAKRLDPDAILFMTDGEVWGDVVSGVEIPTGWVLTCDGKRPYNFGDVVLKLPGISNNKV